MFSQKFLCCVKQVIPSTITLIFGLSGWMVDTAVDGLLVGCSSDQDPKTENVSVDSDSSCLDGRLSFTYIHIPLPVLSVRWAQK